MSLNINAPVIISSTWTVFKSFASSKLLSIQYDDDGTVYTIYSFDQNIAYTCTIWKGTVPDSVISGGYSQEQNDADKSDFEDNFKSSANTSIITIVRDKFSTSSDITSVSASNSNVALLASNLTRLGATFYNDSSNSLYLKLGATASTSSFTVKILTNGYYELPFSYTGVIDGIWDGTNGAVRITELS